MANQIGDTISKGHYFNVCTDETNQTFETRSFYTDSGDVSFADGKNAENKVGAIKGITSDLNTTATGYAADMTTVAKLNSSLVDIYVGSDGKLHKTKGGADTVLPFSSKVKVTIVGTLREGHYAYRNSGGEQEYGWYYGSKDITIVINPDGTCTTKTFEIIGSPSFLNNAEINQINGMASFTIKSIKFG